MTALETGQQVGQYWLHYVLFFHQFPLTQIPMTSLFIFYFFHVTEYIKYVMLFKPDQFGFKPCNSAGEYSRCLDDLEVLAEGRGSGRKMWYVQEFFTFHEYPLFYHSFVFPWICVP